MNYQELRNISVELNKPTIVTLAKEIGVYEDKKSKIELAKKIAEKDEDFLRQAYEVRRMDIINRPIIPYIPSKKMLRDALLDSPQVLCDKLNRIHANHIEDQNYREAYTIVKPNREGELIEIVFKFENRESYIEEWDQTISVKRVSAIKIRVDLRDNSLTILPTNAKSAKKKINKLIGDISELFFNDREIFKKREFTLSSYNKIQKRIIDEELKSVPEKDREKKREEAETMTEAVMEVDFPGLNQLTFKGNDVNHAIKHIKQNWRLDFREHGRIVKFETRMGIYRNGIIALKGATKLAEKGLEILRGIF